MPKHLHQTIFFRQISEKINRQSVPKIAKIVTKRHIWSHWTIYEFPFTVDESQNFAQSRLLFHKHRISSVPDSKQNTTWLDRHVLNQQNAEKNKRKTFKLLDCRGDLNYNNGQ